jgi:hypothetical protein
MMPNWIRNASLLACTTVAVCLQGCESGCDDETVERAVAFLDAHQSCETDDDCVTVHDACEEIPDGYCGQIAMSREGAESSEWNDIQAELEDCAPSECTVCGAALVPRCFEGSCDSR